MTEKQLNQPCLATNDAELFLIINFWIYAHCAADTLLETAKQSRDDFKDVHCTQIGRFKSQYIFRNVLFLQ